MSVDPLEVEADPRSVRVELLDNNASLTHEVGVPSRSERGQSRWPAAAMILAAVALLGGLWWAAGFESTEAAQSDRPALVDRFEGDGFAGAPEPVDSLEPAVAPSSTVSWTPLETELSHVVRGPRGLMAAGDWAIEAPGREPRQPVLTRLSYPNVWTFGTVQNIPRGARIVGLSRLDDQILVFASTTNVSAESDSELAIYSSEGGTDDVWKERNRFMVPGHIRSLSERDGRWVATVDPRAQATTSAQPMRTTVITGTVDGVGFDTTSVAPDEFISSYAAIEQGFIAIVVRVQLQALEENAQPPQLRQWSPEDGWSVFDTSDVNPFGPTSAAGRIIDSGENGLHIAFGTELYSGSGFPLEWELAATGTAVAGALGEPFAPEITAAHVGPGNLIVETVFGDVQTIWISTDGALWQRHQLRLPVRRVELLQIVDGVALLSGLSGSTPGVLRIDLATPPGQGERGYRPDVRERTVEDGEWSTPVFTTAQIDGTGFVGLTNTNGEIVLLESSLGFEVDQRTPTNFPFGYFVNDMQTTSAGYSVVGRLGLLEDAVFVSTDGVDWKRFPIKLPGDATALQIDHFHRTAEATALVGSLGWTDDLSRAERVVLWWDADDKRHVVPARPCGGGTNPCSITSITVVEDGLIATHGLAGSSTVSKWTLQDNWRSFPELDPSPLADGNLYITNGDSAWFLSTERMASSGDGGTRWTFGVQAPPGAVGRFTAVSGSGAASVFETTTDLWFRSAGLWTQYELDDIVVGKVLAITDDIALLSGTLPAGPVVIRLVARAATN